MFIVHLSILIYFMLLKYMATGVRHKLSKLNNKSVLQHKQFRLHVSDSYIEFNTLSVTLLHEQQLLLLVRKIIHHTVSVVELLLLISLCILRAPELRHRLKC